MMRKRIGLLQRNLALWAVLLTSANSYANLVTPNPNFGNATNVKVGSMVTSSGSRVDLVAATNSKGHTFTGATWVTADGKQAWIASHSVDSRLRNQAGAMSAGTVKATIHQKVSKPTVMAKILEQARTGGKALGRFAVGNSPYGRAFWLALGALELSKYFWSDEKGDFVKKKDDDTYVVVATGKNSPVYSSGVSLDDKSLNEVCQKYNLECNIIGYYQGMDNAYNQALNYCKSQSFEPSSGNTLNFNEIGWSGFCTRDGFYQSSTRAVKIFKYVDFVPISLDEFIDEATPEADGNPNDWVETSGVQPTDEPTVTVPAGTVAQTNPYTDPKDGKTKQTRWDFEPNGKVKETEIPRPDLTPDSPEAPRIDPPKDDTGTDTDTGKDKPKDDDTDKDDKDKDKQEQLDLCEKNPDILACDKQPDKPNVDDLDIPTENVNVFFTPDTIFPTTGVCPAPVSFQVDIPFAGVKTFEFDTMPICEIAKRLRNLLIAIAWLVTAVFCFRSFSASK